MSDNYLNEILTANEAEEQWKRDPGEVKSLCRQGHILARLFPGVGWLVTRAAMTARFGPQPTEFLKTHRETNEYGLEVRC